MADTSHLFPEQTKSDTYPHQTAEIMYRKAPIVKSKPDPWRTFSNASYAFGALLSCAGGIEGKRHLRGAGATQLLPNPLRLRGRLCAIQGCRAFSICF